MATRNYYHFFATSLFLFLTLVPLEMQSKPDNANPFGFLKNFKGCKKGQKVNGLHQLKEYLAKFGYLGNHQGVSQNDVTRAMKKINRNEDLFDDSLEKAIKMYQLNYWLNVTGYLDAPTVKQMMKPRCGFADIINGQNTMQRKSKTTNKIRKSIHEVSHYSVLGTRWPSSEYQLTYKILSETLVSGAENMRAIVYDALNQWAQYSPFTFQEVTEASHSNLVFGFFQGDHEDGSPFDGPGGVLAHAFPPTNGDSHFDSTENWSDDPEQDQMDLYSVVLHEIGHLLGLGHTQDENAVMFPSIASGVRKRDLQDDDVQGIQYLYGSN